MVVASRGSRLTLISTQFDLANMCAVFSGASILKSIVNKCFRINGSLTSNNFTRLLGITGDKFSFYPIVVSQYG